MGLVVYQSSFGLYARGKHAHLTKADRIMPGYAHIVMVLPDANEWHVLHDCPVFQPHRQHHKHNVVA